MPKKKILIIIAFAAVLILAGLTLIAIKSFRSGTTLTHETPEGTRSINLPAIPGMEKISEEEGECFQKTTYVYTLTKIDISSHLVDQLKSAFSNRGWQLTAETAEILTFTTTAQRELEKIILRFGFEEGKGTLLTLEYQWPPCSNQE